MTISLERAGFADQHGSIALGSTTAEPSWREHSKCLQTENPDIFFDGGGVTQKAKRICRACPVREQCLELSLVNNERFGVWGGLTRAERRALVKRRSTGVVLDDDETGSTDFSTDA